VKAGFGVWFGVGVVMVAAAVVAVIIVVLVVVIVALALVLILVLGRKGAAESDEGCKGAKAEDRPHCGVYKLAN
jgi:flagellar basal body-associated protein FliL